MKEDDVRKAMKEKETDAPNVMSQGKKKVYDSSVWEEEGSGEGAEEKGQGRGEGWKGSGGK